MCKHNWSREEYRDNQYRFIEIFWCPDCGAVKRVENFQGGGVKEKIKTPNLYQELFFFVAAIDDIVKALEHKIFYTLEDAKKYRDEAEKQLGMRLNIYARGAVK